MSLPTPPEAPQKPAQKQEIPSNVYLYDKNDTSPIPLTYDVMILVNLREALVLLLVGQLVHFLLLAASGISLI